MTHDHDHHHPGPNADTRLLLVALGVILAFTALELAYVDPGNPRALALAIALYS